MHDNLQVIYFKKYGKLKPFVHYELVQRLQYGLWNLIANTITTVM